MQQQRPFRLLLKLFQDRFFESDDLSPGGSFQTNLQQVLGFLLTMGFVVAYLMMPASSSIVNRNHGADLNWALRGLQMFSPAYAFAVTGFATFFEWDMLFPNRRDFLILAPFPIRLRDLFAAQLAALLKFVALLTFSANIFQIVCVALMCTSARFSGRAARMVAAEIAATLGVSAFAFFGIAALQGVLMNVTSPRSFRKISVYVQMCGMSLMILSLLTWPIYLQLLQRAVEGNQLWLWLFPPVWFTGMYDLFFPDGQGLFVALGRHAQWMLGGAVVVFAISWAVGFARHYRRTLESEDTSERAGLREGRTALARSPQESAIFRFSGKTLARSRKHQLFLVTYLSVGISLAVNVATDVHAGRLARSDNGVRTFPFLIAFFVISGFRAVFQFPAELGANWLFRMTESRWGEISRTVTRKRVLVSGLTPLLLVLLPVEVAAWGVWRGPLHTVFQFAAGALLVEVVFWSFDKVPFTCSYFPGATSLSILFVLYLYGFTFYSSHMSELELAMEQRAVYAVVVFVAAAGLLAWSWGRRPAASEVRFDASEPVIQTLDLS